MTTRGDGRECPGHVTIRLLGLIHSFYPRPSFQSLGYNSPSLNSVCFPAALPTVLTRHSHTCIYIRAFAFTRIRTYTQAHTNIWTQVQEQENDPSILSRTRPPTIKSRGPCWTVTALLAHGYRVVNWYKGDSKLVITGYYTSLMVIERCNCAIIKSMHDGNISCMIVTCDLKKGIYKLVIRCTGWE